MRNIKYLMILAASLFAAGRLYAQEAPAGGVLKGGSFNIGLNYPGGSLRYFTSDRKAVELFAQGQDKVLAGGLRLYYYPVSLAKGQFHPYFAAEGDYIGFKGRYSKGSGLGIGGFGGMEYFMGRRFSMQSDVGMLYLSIRDKDTSLGESGLEFLMNVGFNVYFGGGAK